MWHKRKHKVQYPVIAEPKYDEIRVHVKLDFDHKVIDEANYFELKGISYLSYAGKPLNNLEVLTEQLRDFAIDYARLFGGIPLELDCGFEVNGNFNDSYRWVRSKTVPPELVDASLKMIVFDLPLDTRDYSARRYSIQQTVRAYNNYVLSGVQSQPQIIVCVPSKVCETPEEVDAAYETARAEGLEGLMVKNPHGLYQRGKRTDDWLKMKPEDDADGIVVEILRAVSITGEPLNRAGSIRIRMEDGSEACPHGIPHELGEDMWSDPEKYIGQWAEFRFMERDRQGGYRHPVFGRLREAKQ